MRRLRLSSDESSHSNANSNECLYVEPFLEEVCNVHNQMKSLLDHLYLKPDQDDLRAVSLPASPEFDRSSPPLYEVELTASDEDDDGSVLELVIPMQSSRYQRVPTSSPKKTKQPKSIKRYICGLFCCVRSRK